MKYRKKIQYNNISSFSIITLTLFYAMQVLIIPIKITIFLIIYLKRYELFTDRTEIIFSITHFNIK